MNMHIVATLMSLAVICCHLKVAMAQGRHDEDARSVEFLASDLERIEDLDEKFTVDPKVKIVGFRGPWDDDSIPSTYTNRELGIIAKFPNVEYLMIQGPTTPINQDTARLIAGLKHLRSLGLVDARVNPDALQILLGHSYECLAIDGVAIGQSIDKLATERLKVLRLYRTGIYDSAAATIGSAKHLQELDLSENENLGPKFIESLDVMPNLERLYVGDIHFDANTFKALTGFEKLKKLRCQPYDQEDAALLKRRLIGLEISGDTGGIRGMTSGCSDVVIDGTTVDEGDGGK